MLSKRHGAAARVITVSLISWWSGCQSDPPPSAAGSAGNAYVGAAGQTGQTNPVGQAGQAGTTPTPPASGGGAGATGSAGRQSSAASGAGAVGAAGSSDVVPAAGSGGAGEAAAGVGGERGEPTAGAESAAGAGSPAAAGAGEEAGAGGAAGTAAEPHEDLGEGDGRDVITIGDSWMNNTLGTGSAIEGALDRLTMRRYRHFAVQGVMLLQASLFGPAIPSQYATAKRQNPDIKTVIMTGGGNDIIQNASVQSSCSSGGDACKAKLAEISAALDKLWTEMGEDGVKDVVLIRYSDDAGSTDQSVRDQNTKPIAACTTGKIRCHTVATTEAVMGQLQDGIHPTRAANDRIAKVVYQLLTERGIRR